MSELPIMQKTHHVTDLESANDFQKKHTPFVEVVKVEGGYEVGVKLGHYFPHPNEAGHFFDFIELYVNDVPVARFSGAAGLVAPELALKLEADAEGSVVAALASCNLHGTWKAEVQL